MRHNKLCRQAQTFGGEVTQWDYTNALSVEVMKPILNGEMITTGVAVMFIPAKNAGLFGRMVMQKPPKAPNNCFNLTKAG
jgi:hypothetical protein